jgi:PAS domain S-box-containing protein
VESVADYAIFMLDPGGHIVSWNIGAERAKGYTADDVLGRHFSIFYPAEAVAAEHPQKELEIASLVGRYEEEGWRVRKDGSTFWANVIITAIRDRKGELLGFAKVTRDVTERRQLLEDLRAAAAERIQLLAVTAHELRTPVAIVNGFVKTLAGHWDELHDTERRQMVESAARGGDRLGRLVDDLLMAARLESGALEMRTRRFDLAALVEESVADIGPGDIEIDTESVDVLADRDRVQQMVANYLTNAVRYGTRPIKVTVSVVDAAARVVVSDVGPGIDQALEPRLFTKFAGGGSQDSTGLGLFIVRELARAQGGDAWYEPLPSGGSAFALRLPLAT